MLVRTLEISSNLLPAKESFHFKFSLVIAIPVQGFSLWMLSKNVINLLSFVELHEMPIPKH